MKIKLCIRKILFLLLLALAITRLFARDVEIIVIDADLDLPLEGAIINSWDGSQYICNKEGKTVIYVPENRRVVIQASYPGYETGRFLITADTDIFTVRLFLSEIFQSKELVIEASKPGENETKTGRSVAVSGREMAQTARIGAIEDTMASVKLLPGVIATEHFDASPSIRGGEPQDVNASLNGFYIAFPYFWGGAFSIFDPRMIESVQLSHGVFSSRHGRTVSGLIDLTTKKPSSSESEIEIGTDASALRINLSVPLNGKGGILFMGRITYIEPIFALSKLIVNLPEVNDEIKDLVNSINRAPFIRSQTVTGNYDFSDKLGLSATAFFGVDGTGVKFENNSKIEGLYSYEKMMLDYTHYQGFLTGTLSWNPRYDMLLRFTAGAGFQNKVSKEENLYNIYDKYFSIDFQNKYNHLSDIGLIDFNEEYDLQEKSFHNNSQLIYNVQGRFDFDWDIGNNLLLAMGLQEMFRRYKVTASQNMRIENWLRDSQYKEEYFQIMGITDPDDRSYLEDYLMVSSPAFYNNNVSGNILFNTSGYGLIEYNSKNGRFGFELGLRADHYYLLENGMSLGSKPVLNPRLNLDFNILKNRFIFDSVSLTAGTGLFSSMTDVILTIEDKNKKNEIKPTRSWTSVIGTKLEFHDGIFINIESYYKYIFDRMYVPLSYDIDGNAGLKHFFNGKGISWGIDIILQKARSRYWDGWISYSYNWTQHRDPDAENNKWYFPSYHRFHTLNIVLNVRPVQHINIFMRFGLAGGLPLMKRKDSKPEIYPMYVYDNNTDQFIEKYFWPEIQDNNNRTTALLQMDLKISFFGNNKAGKTRFEAYFAVENILSLLYISQGNKVFNPYTGKVATGRTSASYGLPFPIPSFGVNFYY